jgi:hypothetical protein
MMSLEQLGELIHSLGVPASLLGSAAAAFWAVYTYRSKTKRDNRRQGIEEYNKLRKQLDETETHSEVMDAIENHADACRKRDQAKKERDDLKSDPENKQGTATKEIEKRRAELGVKEKELRKAEDDVAGHGGDACARTPTWRQFASLVVGITAIVHAR